MLRNIKYCTQITGFLQHASGIPHRNLRGQLQHFSRLLSNGSDDRKYWTFRVRRPYQSARLYSSGCDKKSGGDDCSKPVKPTGEECKPITPMPLDKGADAYKSPCPPEGGKRASLKIMPAGQECGKPHMMQDCPQPECPYDDNRKPDYTKLIIGGILFLAAALLALYYAGVFGEPEEEEDEKPKRKKRRPRKIEKFPKTSEQIPNCVPYVLIGGGTASFAAFRAIKSADPSAKVLVIDSDEYYPYMRPPLSKEIWFNEDPNSTKKLQFKQWNGSERSLYYEPPDFYTDVKKLKATMTGGVAVARGWTVKKVDAYEKKVYLEDDYAIEYDKCLIATGSSPKNLALFEDASINIKDRVTLYRGIFDFEELEEIIRETEPKGIAIVGGGFLGSELACSLARRARGTGMKVHQIFREGGNMGKVLPEYLSSWTTKKVQAEGVDVIPNTVVDDVSMTKDNLTLILSNGKKISADQVIVAIGVTPNTELAELSCLEVDPDHGGFLVNAELMARSNLWSAGDCTCFYDVKLGRRRVEHHDHAVVSGRLAGENMTGAGKPYYHQSMFWSDLGPDVGYEAIGVVDSSLPTVGVFARATEKDTPKAVVEATDEGNRAKTEAEAGMKTGGARKTKCDDEGDVKAVVEPEKPAEEPEKPAEEPEKSDVPAEQPKSQEPQEKPNEDYGKGVIFYLRDDIVVGIVMWNVFNRMSVARQVLKEEVKYSDLNEVAKLFNIHED